MKPLRYALLLVLFGGFLLGKPAHAEFTCTTTPDGVTAETIQSEWISVAVGIPGVTISCTEFERDPNGRVVTAITRDYIEDMGAYIGGLYKFFAGAIGIIAAAMVFYGGIKWIAAAGNASKIKDAKETVFSALIAIVITLSSYLLLYIINPKLVNLRPPVLKLVDPVVQQYADCPSTKQCLSGSLIGRSCERDSDCGANAKSGTCSSPVVLGNDTQPLCGKTYQYSTPGAGTGSCTGKTCSITSDLCVIGKYVDTRDGRAFVSDPVAGTELGCVNEILACEQVSDALGVSVGTVGPGRHDGLCQPFSREGSRLCKWYTAGTITNCDNATTTDYCKSWPVLTCPSAYPIRVGGEVCEREQVPNGNGAINFGTKMQIRPFDFSPVTGSCYNASAAEVIYDGTLASNGQVVQSQCQWEEQKKLFQSLAVRGICCMKATANVTSATDEDLICHVTQ